MSMRELVFYDKAGNVVGRAPVPDEADSAQLLLPPPNDGIISLDELNSTPGLNAFAEFFEEHPTLMVRQPAFPKPSGTQEVLDAIQSEADRLREEYRRPRKISIQELIHPPEDGDEA